jgi:repressor LexA
MIVAHDSRPPEISGAERALLAGILDWTAEHGLPPTIDDLADALSLARSTVHSQRQQLKAKGLIDYRHGSRRSTRVVADAATLSCYGLDPGPAASIQVGPKSRRAVVHPVGHPAGERVFALPPRPRRRFPVAAGVAAGPMTPVARDDDVIEVDPELVGPGLYALRVSGDSMVDLGILDGDKVVVDPDQPAREGDLVAVMIPSEQGDDGLATVKVLTRQGGRTWLATANPAYPPIPLHEADVIGRVTTVVRRC